jgi:DNA helicase-2/ATP-dependent DNA helicase PcrA
MRNLQHARTRAREVREAIGREPDGLFERMEAYILSEFTKYLTPLATETMQGSRAEVALASPVLRYDEKLDKDPEQRLLVITHELGHLELHKRLSDPNVPPDPLLGSGYMGSGAAGIARYSEKAKEEAQANAFATEFLCPSAEALQEWLAGTAPGEIARRRGIALDLVHAQLAEALFQFGIGPHVTPSSGSEREPTNAQKSAAGDFACPVLVVAGPGTGKTRTLVLRIEYLLQRDDVRPEQILVLTFSVEAADELRERVALRFGDDVADAMEISTFHGWGYVFLHHFAPEAGLPSELILLDEPAQAEVVLDVLASVDCDAILNLRDPRETARKAAESIAFLKDRLVGPDELEREIHAWVPREGESDTKAVMEALLAVYRAYDAEPAAVRRGLRRPDHAPPADPGRQCGSACTRGGQVSVGDGR